MNNKRNPPWTPEEDELLDSILKRIEYPWSRVSDEMQKEAAQRGFRYRTYNEGTILGRLANRRRSQRAILPLREALETRGSLDYDERGRASLPKMCNVNMHRQTHPLLLFEAETSASGPPRGIEQYKKVGNQGKEEDEEVRDQDKEKDEGKDKGKDKNKDKDKATERG